MLEFINGLRTFDQLFQSELQVATQRAEALRRLKMKMDIERGAAVSRGMESSVEDDSNVAEETRLKIEQESLSFLEEKAKLQKQIASDEERQMMEMQEEYDKYAQLLKSTLGTLPIAQQTLLQMKKDAMAADAERALEEDKLNEEKRQARKIEDAADTAGPGKMMQNSVEEYVYLKTQRDNAKQEAKQEKRYQEDRELKIRLHTETKAAIESLSVSQQPGMDNNTVAIP